MLDLYTVIWGKEMTEGFLKVCLPSLLQPGNIPGCANRHTYTFYASEEAREQIKHDSQYRDLDHTLEVLWYPLQKGEWETTSNTLHQLKRSAAEGHYVLIMAPDNAVGNGSLQNLGKLCDGHHNPILFGFPRLNAKGWEELESLFINNLLVSNRQLVTLAMSHIEQTTYAIDNWCDRHGIVHGNAWLVKHNVPTPCILPDDRVTKIFSENPTVNSGFDHILPYRMIQAKYPWYLIRHSDIFFLVERGRHLIIEGSGQDQSSWDTVSQLLGVEFFNKQEAVWQGV